MPNLITYRVEHGAMTRYQWSIIAVCFVLNVLDGFDVLVMAFTAGPVSKEWGLTSSALGFLLSAGLLGMSVGTFVIAPFADRYGRRPVIMSSLVLASAGMICSAAAQSALQLGLLRILTGLGVGAIVATANVVASEFASTRWRGMAVSLNGTGYALGSVIGGVLAFVLVAIGGWRFVFLAGGIASAAMIPAVYLRLPESPDFLLAKRPTHALRQLNALSIRLGHPPITELPAVATEPARRGLLYDALDSARTLVSPVHRRSTILIWISFFLCVFSLYFVLSWTPKLLVEAGMSQANGIAGGTLLGAGGVFGTAILGFLASRIRIKNLVMTYLLCTAALLVVFAFTASTLAIALAVAFLIGFFLNGSQGGLNTLPPIIYPTSVRATGMGTALAIGRIGAFLSPVIAGALLDAGWTPSMLFVSVAVCFALAAFTLTWLPVPGSTVPPARIEPATEAGRLL